MSQLITMHDNQPTVSHRAIAENAENKAQNIKELVDDHKLDFEEFGVIRFETEKGKGRPTVTYYLNEQQATLLLTYLKNTLAVRAFKVALVKEFYKLREELYPKQPEITITNTTDREIIGTLEQQVYMLKNECVALRRVTNRMTYNDKKLPQLESKKTKLYTKGVIPELSRRIKELSERIGEDLGTVGKPYTKELDAFLRFFNEKPQQGGNFIALGDTFFPHDMIK